MKTNISLLVKIGNTQLSSSPQLLYRNILLFYCNMYIYLLYFILQNTNLLVKK